MNDECHHYTVKHYGIGNLKKHIKIHDASRVIETCAICNNSVKHLKKHVKDVHEYSKKYSCKYCSKLFSRQSHLKKHISVVHEGLKNHKCNYCNKLFGLPGTCRNMSNIFMKKLRNITISVIFVKNPLAIKMS